MKNEINNMSMTGQDISRLSLLSMKETQQNRSGHDLEHRSGFSIMKGKVVMRNRKMRIKSTAN